MQLTRESFLAVPAPKVHRIEIPELGGHVWLKPMSAGERDRFEIEHEASKKLNFRARLAAASLSDEDGNLLFGPEDIPALSALPATAFDPILETAVKINGLTKEDIEELEKKC